MFGSEAFVHPEYDHIMVSGGTVFLPGLIAFCALLCSFQSVSSWIAQEREKGGLKRLSATPLTPAAYFAGKMGMVIITVLSFASCVFLVAPNFPVWLTRVAQVFPLYLLASGMRSVFMPAEMYSFLAVGEAPQLWLGAIVLAAWVIVGLLLAIRTFQWNPRR